MDLYILRHGKAEPAGPKYPSDYVRPLTRKGRNRTERSARGMKVAGVIVDKIISSPLVRAHQTAEIVHEGLGVHADIELSDVIATGDLGAIVDTVRAHEWRSKGVMLVGHEPTLSRLISVLVCGVDDAAIDLRTGGMCKLEARYMDVRQCATILWFLTAKQLAALGK